jgi:hypothetical protein
MKRATNRWQYVGDFRVERLSTDADEISRYERKADRTNDVSMVLFLARVE